MTMSSEGNGSGNVGGGGLQTASAMNLLRMRSLVDRLSDHFSKGLRSSPGDLFYICLHLSKSIDHAVTHNEVPPMARELPSLIKQVYQYKSDTVLQSGIMLLMISVKNACGNGWFMATDSNELLSLANEISSCFCGTESIIVEPSVALHVISKVMPRFYPRMKMGNIIVSLIAKPGYDILVADFHISKSMQPTAQERIRLFVAQTDNMETSSCIISPQNVNFLLNGKGVERRTTVSMDSGPQFPTDVTTMLRYGPNLLQAIGHFNGNYIIALGYVSIASSPDSTALQDYVQPAAAHLASEDAEIIEGPSRISLNCPISYKRISTPAKGHLCRHHQCFDYDNFMEINSRKPSWRCPHCNQFISCADLRIDQNMVKVLREVGADVADVLISSDGSWEVAGERDNHSDRQIDGSVLGQKDGLEDCNSMKDILANVVDLTTEETYDNNVINSIRAEISMGYANQRCTSAWDSQDRKPFLDNHIGLPVTEKLSESTAVNGTLEMDQEAACQIGHEFWSRILSSASACNGSVAPNSESDGNLPIDAMLPPVLTDALIPALNRDPVDECNITQSATIFQNVPQAGPIVAAENLQLQQPQFMNSITSSETERPSIPRHVSRVPVAIQALPAQTQVPNSHHVRARANVLSPNPTTVNSAPPGISRTLTSVAATPDSYHVNHDRQDLHYVSSQSFQHLVGVPTTTSQIGTRTPSELQRTGAYRSSTGPDHQNPHHQLPSNQRMPQTNSQPSNLMQQFSHFSSLQTQPSAQGAGLAAANTTNHHSRLISSQQTSQMARPSGVTSQLQTPRSAPPYPIGDSIRLSTGEQRWNFGGGTQSIPNTDNLLELPSEQNWRPSGRMRGSLTGRAYSAAALSQLIIQPTPSAQARPPVTTMARPSVTTSTATTSEQLQVLISNRVNSSGQSQA